MGFFDFLKDLFSTGVDNGKKIVNEMENKYDDFQGLNDKELERKRKSGSTMEKLVAEKVSKERKEF